MRLIDADVLPEISLFGTTEYINVRKAPTVPAVTLDRIKEAREEIIKASYPEDEEYSFSKIIYLGEAVAVLDKLIAESEEEHDKGRSIKSN